MSTLKHKHSLQALVVRGLAFQFVAKGGERVLRLAAFAFLARILSEHDFGLMAAVAAALAGVEALTYLPSEAAITASVHGRERRFLDTVFWVQSVRGVSIALVIVAISPLLAHFFGQPDHWPMFAAIAVQPLVTGFTSPRAEVLLKDLRMGAWSAYRFTGAVIGLAVTIGLAIQLKSAWALIVGQIATQVIIVTCGYAVAPFAPKWEFDRGYWKEIRAYCVEAAGIPILIAMVYQAPAFLVGKISGLAVLGVFMLNKRLADLPIEIALGVVGQVAVPAYASIKHDRERLAKAWLTGLRWVCMLAMPTAAGLFWVGPALSSLVYGDKYAGAKALFGVLALDGAFAAMLAVTGPLFWGVGRPSLDRWCQIVRVAMLLAAGVALTYSLGAIGLGIALAGSSLVAGVVGMALACRVTGLRMSTVLRGGVLPGFGCAGVILAVLVLIDKSFAPIGLVRIMISGLVGLVFLVSVPLRPLLKQLRRPRPQAPSTELAASAA